MRMSEATNCLLAVCDVSVVFGGTVKDVLKRVEWRRNEARGGSARLALVLHVV
jgi:hypothetical protein